MNKGTWLIAYSIARAHSSTYYTQTHRYPLEIKREVGFAINLIKSWGRNTNPYNYFDCISVKFINAMIDRGFIYTNKKWVKI